MNWADLKLKIRAFDKDATDCLAIYFDAHRFIEQNNLRKYLLISGVAFLLLFTISIKALIQGLNALEPSITEGVLPYLERYLTIETDQIRKGIQATFWLIKKAIDNNKDVFFSFVFLIIGTPFFSYISSKTEEIYSGKTYKFELHTFLEEIKRGISLSIRNSLKQLGIMMGITLLSFIPLVEIVTPLLTFIVQAYYNGILMTDYTLERQEYSVKDSEVFYGTHQAEMFAIGLGFMFLLLIPVIGWFLAPTYGLVASYLYFEKQRQ